MANQIVRDLSKTLLINEHEFNINAKTAETADKVENKLTIKTVQNGVEKSSNVFDGSEAVTVTIDVANTAGTAGIADKADTIKVHTDNSADELYTTFTISKNDPTQSVGQHGDIWFKYISG